MSYVAHHYSRVNFYSSLEVNLSLYYGGVIKDRENYRFLGRLSGRGGLLSRLQAGMY